MTLGYVELSSDLLFSGRTNSLNVPFNKELTYRQQTVARYWRLIDGQPFLLFFPVVGR